MPSPRYAHPAASSKICRSRLGRDARGRSAAVARDMDAGMRPPSIGIGFGGDWALYIWRRRLWPRNVEDVLQDTAATFFLPSNPVQDVLQDVVANSLIILEAVESHVYI